MIFSHLQLSNPFGGKSSNLLGVDIFLLLASLDRSISVQEKRGIRFAWEETRGLVSGGGEGYPDEALSLLLELQEWGSDRKCFSYIESS